MKFLVDECVGRKVFSWLEEKGFDVLFVKEESSGASDDWVLAKALQENRILITCDKDFGDMVFRDQKTHKGIILLRLTDEKSTNKIHVIGWILENHISVIRDSFVVANDKNIRIIQVGSK